MTGKYRRDTDAVVKSHVLYSGIRWTTIFLSHGVENVIELLQHVPDYSTTNHESLSVSRELTPYGL